jgi:hypothetical protein
VERLAVFILFLILNLAGLGTVGSPPEQGISPGAKVTSARTAVVQNKLQAGTIRPARETTVNEHRLRQG